MKSRIGIQFLVLQCIVILASGDDMEDIINNVLSNVIGVDPRPFLPVGYLSQNPEPSLNTNKVIRSNLVDNESDTVTTTSTTTTRSTTTTEVATTTTTSNPTSGICYEQFEVCRIAGSLVVQSGLTWSEELLHPVSSIYQKTLEHMETILRHKFDVGYYGNYTQSVYVEAFSKRPEGGVFIDIYLQFSNFLFDISADDIIKSFGDVLDVKDNLQKLGIYEIDLDASYFNVIDQFDKVVSEAITSEGEKLPEWALLVIIGGSIAIIIIVLVGGIDGIWKRIERKKMMAKSRLVGSSTITTVKDLFHQSMTEDDLVDGKDNTNTNTYQKRDGRDMWTMQKIKEKNSTLSRPQPTNRQTSVLIFPESSLESKLGLLDKDYQRTSNSISGSSKFSSTDDVSPTSNQSSRANSCYLSFGSEEEMII